MRFSPDHVAVGIVHARNIAAGACDDGVAVYLARNAATSWRRCCRDMLWWCFCRVLTVPSIVVLTIGPSDSGDAVGRTLCTLAVQSPRGHPVVGAGSVRCICVWRVRVPSQPMKV